MPASSYLHEKRRSTFPTSAGACTDFRGHYLPEPTYLATHAAPHWGFFFGISDAWLIDGSAVAWAIYWALAESQHQLDSSIVGGGPGTRTDQILSPILVDNGQQAFLAAYCNSKPWIGVSRFQLATADVPDSVQLSAAVPATWVIRNPGTPDCVLTPGTDVVLSAFAVATAQIDLMMGSFTVAPFLQLALAKDVQVSWETTNVASVTVQAVGVDGSVTTLGTAAGTYPLPAGAETDYAGSWAIDNGVGVVTDTGVDTGTTGISSSEMGAPITSFMFELMAGYTYKSIRFLVTPVSMSSPVTLHWPKFDLHNEHPELVWESSKACDLLYANGPGLRYGNWDYVVGGLWTNPPDVVGLGAPSTIIDALAFNHLVLKADAGSALDTTITAEIATLFDAYEGQSIVQVDDVSKGVPLPKGSGETIRFALVNSLSELPPMPAFPVRQRAADWTPTGAWGQVVYDWCQEPRFLVARAQQIDLWVAGTQWSSPSLLAVPGWRITQYNHAVTGSETDARIKAGSVEFAHAIRPWHGWFCVCPPLEILGKLANLHTAFGQFIRAVAGSDGVRVWGAQFGAPDGLVWQTMSLPTSSPMTHVHMAELLGDDGIYLMASDETTLKRFVSFDAGATWLEATPMTGVIFEKGATSHSDVLTILGFVSGSNTLKGEIQMPGDTGFGSTFTAKTDSGSDLVLAASSDFDISYSWDADDALILSCIVTGESAPSEWRSWDYGRTFQRVT